ncbi:MAG: hypothetical protein KBT13_10850 [Bacteroidales bacterium]|uniref:hypothetical protein n=1 Tax=Sodaliphilus sp. TaxID=2815818 RepID=UPI001B44CBE5|nr:hypothetical protein [Candidatus Sodaliphilus limicaballi]
MDVWLINDYSKNLCKGKKKNKHAKVYWQGVLSVMKKHAAKWCLIGGFFVPL